MKKIYPRYMGEREEDKPRAGLKLNYPHEDLITRIRGMGWMQPAELCVGALMGRTVLLYKNS